MIKEFKNLKICIVGLGYIGLPTAAILTNAGFKVLGVDINNSVIDVIKKGKIHIKENGLEDLISKAIKKNLLEVSNIPKAADIFIISVPTPLKKDNNGMPEPDISCVLKALDSISPFIKKGDLLIIESTCPVGTSKILTNKLQENTNIDFKDLNVAYCPERVLPGNILFELIHNDRVIGGVNQRSADLAKSFYQAFCNGELFMTSSETAEMVKLTENAYRDLNIAFANQLSIICDEIGIDIKELISLSNRHPRVNILKPGCGVGGHCIAIDPWFITSRFPDNSSLIRTAREVNLQKENWVLNKIMDYERKLRDKLKREVKIGCYGITFKPDVDDTRESPAMNIVLELLSNNCNVIICDPNINSNDQFDLVTLDEIYDSVDMHVLLVSHSEFHKFDFINKNVLDFCGLIN
tara:strand:- start:215 stop:1441 length:1227 start_codon:yes stop_codon:yes gene_type:complete